MTKERGNESKCFDTPIFLLIGKAKFQVKPISTNNVPTIKSSDNISYDFRRIKENTEKFMLKNN